ncbi:TIGR01906 family membrane protein [Isachenkonia alkalipeptolytica]|uniref:TIGR01906 family membrane protein n=1 Tax=Isachenkonia alkalipeptolytica TaxID=2565777 RepID=A0AA44BDV3_9CLOT|nr:TIGR01906 family membrane protein [Isachenkonia alkalipeptolytica]NBG87465.1 TIGR01906 family membrane protein [Isachenkonia alkalipeptolytica]
MNRWLKRLLYILAGILLSVVLLLTATELVSFNVDHYLTQFERYDVPEVTGMDMDNLEYTVEDMHRYLRGDDRHRLETEAYFGDELRPVYGEREILHMIDVRDLFVAGRNIRNLGALAFAALMVLMIYKDRDWKKNIWNFLFYTMLGNILFFGVLALLMYVDFGRYFVIFHLIFFDNDLWLLNPQTDTLIQMLPQPFFYNTAYMITGIYAGTMVFLGALGLFMKKRQRKNVIE